MSIKSLILPARNNRRLSGRIEGAAMAPKNLTAVVCALALAGCASTMTPAPIADAVAGAGEGAITRDRGMQMVARAGAWQGTPRNLAERLTPMLLTFSNDSAVPVRIRYKDLKLVTSNGLAYPALPPFRLDGQTAQQTSMKYPQPGFAIAPYLVPFIAGGRAYSGEFEHDTAYWDRYGTVLEGVGLPTADMRQRALPEGVLERGATVSGFVYFPGIGPEVEQVRLRADLMRATDGVPLVSLTIPFDVG